MTAEKKGLRVLICPFLALPIGCKGCAHEAAHIDVNLVRHSDSARLPLYILGSDYSILPDPHVHAIQDDIHAKGLQPFLTSRPDVTG